MVEDLIELELVKISHRFCHNSLPEPVAYLFQHNAFTHLYNTRSRNNPRIEKHKTAVFNKSFLCKSPSLWANLPYNMKNMNKKNLFSNSFKTSRLSHY